MSFRKIQNRSGPREQRVVFCGLCLSLALNPVTGLAEAGLEALPGSPLAVDNPDMRRLACGGAHSLAIKSDGSVWTWGFNGAGQIGDGTWPDVMYATTPVQVLTEVTDVAAADSASFAIKSDGSLWAWGYNEWGQLGDSTLGEVVNRPVQVMTGVAGVAGGFIHSLVLKTDGTLWAFGNNSWGQLGDGPSLNWPPIPVQVPLTEVAAVAAGDVHSLALKTDGTLWAWGGNDYGQLGDGTTAVRRSPVQVLTGVAAVTAGPEHSLALKTDGTLWAWGANSYGQLGDGTTTDHAVPAQVQVPTEVITMATGQVHGLALTTDGTLWAWGSNYYGVLGDGTQTSHPTPIQVTTGVAAVAAGDAHTLAFKTDGSLWAWGLSLHGRLGDGTDYPHPNYHPLNPVSVLGFPPTSAPDFLVTNITLNPSAPLANGTFSASVTVKNRGTAAGTPGTLEVWANQPEAQDCGAVGDRSLTLPTLAAGAKQTVKVSGLPAGAAKYQTLRVVVDNQCQTAESDEANNESVKRYRVVTQPAADVMVTDIVLTPNRPSANGTFSAAVTVKNQGSGSADAGTLALWVDQPAVATCAATGDAAAVIGLLAPGAKRTLTLSGLSAGATGAKSLRAYADSDCTIREADDGNNQRVKAYSVVP